MTIRWMAPLLVACTVIAGAASGYAATSTAYPAGSSTTAYRQGILNVLKMFIAGNSEVGATGADLSKTPPDYKKANSDISKAATKIVAAKSKLDHLTVPATKIARQIQSLYEQAFSKFVRGATGMRDSLAVKNLSKFTKDLNVYKAGLTPFNQATPLWAKLK